MVIRTITSRLKIYFILVAAMMIRVINLVLMFKYSVNKSLMKQNLFLK